MWIASSRTTLLSDHLWWLRCSSSVEKSKAHETCTDQTKTELHHAAFLLASKQGSIDWLTDWLVKGDHGQLRVSRTYPKCQIASCFTAVRQSDSLTDRTSLERFDNFHGSNDSVHRSPLPIISSQCKRHLSVVWHLLSDRIPSVFLFQCTMFTFSPSLSSLPCCLCLHSNVIDDFSFSFCWSCWL